MVVFEKVSENLKSNETFLKCLKVGIFCCQKHLNLISKFCKSLHGDNFCLELLPISIVNISYALEGLSEKHALFEHNF